VHPSGTRDAQATLDAFIEAFADMYFQLDAEGVILDYGAGRTTELYLPPDVFLGKRMRDVLPEDVGRRLDEALKSALKRRRLVAVEYALGLPQGLTDFEARVVPIADHHAVVLVRNVTDRKRLEEQLRQAQKMEAVGKLAGGIAHDFNNLLTAILGYSDLLLREVSGPAKESVEEIRRAGERAAALTRQLLAFSRKQMLRMEVLDVNALVGEMGPLLERLLGDDIVLATRPAESRVAVRADRGQLEQVVLNLAVNARDAMPKGGVLTIAAESRVFSSDKDAIPAGEWVVVSVSDTGAGMDAATKARIFEPFFTTKERGKGTGLGLATVYGAVTQIGGQVLVTSAPGEGARFDVFLPAARGEPDRIPTSLYEDVRGAGETVLVVEDQEAVRKLAIRVLGSHGYDVLEARNGTEAVAIAERHSGRIDLILTDIVMPGMSGPDVVARLSYVHPEMNVLYMSGYSDASLLKQGSLHTGDDFLQKPFTADALVAKVRSVLSARQNEDVA
jgi:signal transduction histidine kinase/CheY-like chemotaxis protein